MAFTPCAFHGAGYKGGASTFFLRLARGQDSIGGKVQVCANCATVALEYLAQRAVKVSEGDLFHAYEEPIACMNCGGDVSRDFYRFYGNAYPRGKVESQWYAKVCEKCPEAVAEDLHLGAAEMRA